MIFKGDIQKVGCMQSREMYTEKKKKNRGQETWRISAFSVWADGIRSFMQLPISLSILHIEPFAQFQPMLNLNFHDQSVNYIEVVFHPNIFSITNLF